MAIAVVIALGSAARTRTCLVARLVARLVATKNVLGKVATPFSSEFAALRMLGHLVRRQRQA